MTPHFDPNDLSNGARSMVMSPGVDGDDDHSGHFHHQRRSIREWSRPPQLFDSVDPLPKLPRCWIHGGGGGVGERSIEPDPLASCDVTVAIAAPRDRP